MSAVLPDGRLALVASWSLSTSPEESEDSDDDSDDNVDEDGDASSPSDDEMSTSYTYPLSLVIKRESSFDMRVVIYIGGELV